MNTVKQLLDEAQELIVAHRVDHAISKLIEVLREMTAETKEVEAEKPTATKATKATTKAKAAKAEAPAEAAPPKTVGTRSGDISAAPNGTILGG